MKKTIRWAALLLAVMMLGGCAQKAKQKAPELMEPVGVQADYATAYISDIYRQTYYSGSIKPYVEGLFFKVSGEVMEVNGSPGMMVEEGDVLIKLDQASLQKRSEQLQEDISYMQQDSEYSDTIASLDIQILEVELRQLKDNETSLKEQETELKEKETELKDKETKLKENETALREKEPALVEKEADLEKKIAALEEKEATLKESAAAPEVSEPAPEESEPTSEVSNPVPEVSEPMPEESEPTSEVSNPVPEVSEPMPEESAPAPEVSEPTPEEIELTKVQEELSKMRDELAAVKKELTQVKEDLILTKKELPLTAEELTLIAEELPLLAEAITQAGKDILLKENEIAQQQTFIRQDKELQALELQNKRNEMTKLGTSLDENSLLAPFSGRIIYGTELVPGSWVNAEDPIVFLADDSKLSVVCGNIAETEIEQADRIFARIGAKDYELKPVPIDPDEYTKMILAGEEVRTTFEIVATEEELKSLEAGQFVGVFIWRDYVPDAVVIPSAAVFKDATGDYVYMDENGSRIKHAVETGVVTDSLVQIVEGLKEGDAVYVKE